MIKKILIPILFCILFASVFPAIAQQKKIKEVKNKKTTEHANIPGTDLYLKIPKGYKQAANFVGWKNDKGSSIIISKRQDSLEDVFEKTKLQLMNKHYVLKKVQKKMLKLNDKDAIYLAADCSSSEKNILLIKKNNSCFIIETVCSEKRRNKKQLRKSLMSVCV